MNKNDLLQTIKDSRSETYTAILSSSNVMDDEYEFSESELIEHDSPIMKIKNYLLKYPCMVPVSYYEPTDIWGIAINGPIQSWIDALTSDNCPEVINDVFISPDIFEISL